MPPPDDESKIGPCPVAPGRETALVRHLAETARDGMTVLDDAAQSALHTFILSQLAPAGGFRGPGGEGDVYFTLFGLACLQAAGITPDLMKTADFLHAAEADAARDLVHLSCLIQSRDLLAPSAPGTASQLQRLLSKVENFRTDDGGFSRKPGQAHGSAYGAYLALLAYGAGNVRVPLAVKLVPSVSALLHACGGFLNEATEPIPTVPATAAAMTVLQTLDTPIPPAVFSWLCGQFGDGGFRASPMSPSADLLSTAVALFALDWCGIRPPLGICRECASFVDEMWEENGGFRSDAMSMNADIEYTFYGLLALGSLKHHFRHQM